MYIWQTKKWWEMLVSSKQAEKIIKIEWIQIEKRRISLWQFGLFIIWLDEKDLTKIEQNKQKLIKICKNEKALFIQVETVGYNSPLITPSSFTEVSEDTAQPQLKLESMTINWFKKGYYKKFITPYTAIIDLNKSEEEILKDMKPKGRYNIKLATKKWIIIKEVEKTKENALKYYNLMMETTSRNWFYWNTLEFYIDFLEKIDNSKLLLAYFEDKVIAWWIFIFDKEVSIYYYWASTSNPKYRNLMAPFLLQWEAIKIAKEYWSKIYDFLWIAKPWNNNSSLKWVTDFKLKLTKNIINVSDSYIYINKKFLYYFIKIVKMLKK